MPSVPTRPRSRSRVQATLIIDDHSLLSQTGQNAINSSSLEKKECATRLANRGFPTGKKDRNTENGEERCGAAKTKHADLSDSFETLKNLVYPSATKLFNDNPFISDDYVEILTLRARLEEQSTAHRERVEEFENEVAGQKLLIRELSVNILENGYSSGLPPLAKDHLKTFPNAAAKLHAFLHTSIEKLQSSSEANYDHLIKTLRHLLSETEELSTMHPLGLQLAYSIAISLGSTLYLHLSETDEFEVMDASLLRLSAKLHGDSIVQQREFGIESRALPRERVDALLQQREGAYHEARSNGIVGGRVVTSAGVAKVAAKTRIMSNTTQVEEILSLPENREGKVDEGEIDVPLPFSDDSGFVETPAVDGL
ncbi:hypothetical protein HYALB_00012349 [Hymenoscyphus albidus]|uniref:Uncharacterized protein n=1 Tax=Hymenoscyphus albidus TaxID=595503 RepID=A0A9N9LUV2_9HELO|nr:hypothetical protein HYALB_00012349 [Hymenoscyphus albidus]